LALGDSRSTPGSIQRLLKELKDLIQERSDTVTAEKRKLRFRSKNETQKSIQMVSTEQVNKTKNHEEVS
jgi:hypothetical protein